MLTRCCSKHYAGPAVLFARSPSAAYFHPGVPVDGCLLAESFRIAGIEDDSISIICLPNSFVGKIPSALARAQRPAK